MIPAPSYSESDKQRGFNHVQEMFSILKLKMCCCIHKINDVKQSDGTSLQRQEIGKHLSIDLNAKLENKKLLIVDDVFTTGSTVKAMINLLKKCHPKKIKILVMSKTKMT